jgi:hypothetical protein
VSTLEVAKFPRFTDAVGALKASAGSVPRPRQRRQGAGLRSDSLERVSVCELTVTRMTRTFFLAVAIAALLVGDAQACDRRGCRGGPGYMGPDENCAAERLVSSSRRQIEIVAAALLRHGTLTGDEVIELLHVRNDHSLQSHWCSGAAVT